MDREVYIRPGIFDDHEILALREDARRRIQHMDDRVRADLQAHDACLHLQFNAAGPRADGGDGIQWIPLS